MVHSNSLWLDSDVILDWLTKRQPWVAGITELVRRSVTGDWCLWVSPLILANVHYLYRKQEGSVKALEAIRQLTMIAEVAPLNSTHVQQALAAKNRDFEDALQIACASQVPGLSAIITRNLRDYQHASVPTMTADAWLEQHPADQGTPWI